MRVNGNRYYDCESRRVESGIWFQEKGSVFSWDDIKLWGQQTGVALVRERAAGSFLSTSTFLKLLFTPFHPFVFLLSLCPITPPPPTLYYHPELLFLLLLPLLWDAVMYLFTAKLLPICHRSILAVAPPISSSSSSPPAITLRPVFQLAFLSPTKHLLSLLGPPFGEGGRPPS